MTLVAASKRRLKAEMGFFSKAPPPEPEPRPKMSINPTAVAYVGSRGGVSTAGIISAGLVLLLLGQLKSLFNEEFLGHTRGWVTVYSAVKVASLWGLAQRLIPSR